jgi:hypothetical protein
MRTAIVFAFALVSSTTLFAQRPAGATSDGPPPTIAAKTASMTNMPGLLPLHWDANTGKLYLEIPLGANGKSAELLYTHSLPYGTGSNDLGLDRGQTSPGRIVRFERTGPKVLLVEPNEAFRSSATDPAEQLSVRQSFRPCWRGSAWRRSRPMARCWWMRRTSFCAMHMAWQRR